jgi:hypothetical protein
MALSKGLVIYPRGEGGDAKYFKMLAKQFKRAHVQTEISVESFGEWDEDEFMADLKKPAHSGLDIFAYIGHGLTNSLYSASISKNERSDFAERIRESCNDGAVVLIYACNCGDLGDSLLSHLQRTLQDKHMTFYGHHTSGRAGNNPDKTVFPPAGGAKLIDHVLGPLARSRRIRNAWRDTFGNESDDLWATFFLLSNEALTLRACASALKSAAAANNRLMREVGWSNDADKLYRFMGVANGKAEELALAIARWQAGNMSAGEADGILGRQTWTALQPKLNAWKEPRTRQPGDVRYGPNP